MQYMQGQKVLILGLGISGLAMARWCVRCGAALCVADTRETPPALVELKRAIPNVKFIQGAFGKSLLELDSKQPVTHVLYSPGLAPHEAGVAEIFAAAKENLIPTQGELGLFVQALGKIDAQQTQVEEALLAQALKDRKAEYAGESVIVQLPVDIDALLEEQDDIDTPQLVADSIHEQAFDLGLDIDAFLNEAQARETEQNRIDPLPVVLGYKPKIIAITGTNGKTTVTSLTGQLVKRAGKRAAVAGNIGTSMLDALMQGLDEKRLPEVWVLELSSFQLNLATAFNPTVSTILNITQDHLDWHGSLDAYIEAKGHVFGENTIRVLNRNDEAVMAFQLKPLQDAADLKKRKRVGRAKEVQPFALTFGVDEPNSAGDFGITEDGGMAWLAQAVAKDETRTHGQEIEMKLLMPVAALRIRGRHNAGNALAALALASQVGCAIGPMLQGLREYRGEPHRVESIGVINGVEYIDDSKGTNVGATAAALEGLGIDHKIVLILGGQGKGQDFSVLVPLVKQYVRAVALIGQDAALIEQALKSTQVPMTHLPSLVKAVEFCAEQAQSGDVVLLSPACASLDMFTNYIERSKAFVQAVQEIAENHGQLVDCRGGGQ